MDMPATDRHPHPHGDASLAVLTAILEAVQSELVESAKRWAEVEKFMRATRRQLLGLGLLLATIVFMVIASWSFVR